MGRGFPALIVRWVSPGPLATLSWIFKAFADSVQPFIRICGVWTSWRNRGKNRGIDSVVTQARHPGCSGCRRLCVSEHPNTSLGSYKLQNKWKENRFAGSSTTHVPCSCLSERRGRFLGMWPFSLPYTCIIFSLHHLRFYFSNSSPLSPDPWLVFEQHNVLYSSGAHERPNRAMPEFCTLSLRPNCLLQCSHWLCTHSVLTGCAPTVYSLAMRSTLTTYGIYT